jgi:hypothetical protein
MIFQLKHVPLRFKLLLIFLVITNGFMMAVIAKPYLDRYLDKNKTYNVVFFGDSITANANWENLLPASDVHTSGYPGFTTSHLVELMYKAVIKYHPKSCYIMAGVNDIKVGVPMRRTFNNFRVLVDTLRSHHITPIIESTLYTSQPDLNIRVDSLNNYLIQLADLEKVHYLNINDILSDHRLIKQRYTSDGLHPNREAYAVWAEKLAILTKK